MIIQWEETQDNFKLNMQRNVYGLHMPVRQLMERNIVGFVRTLANCHYWHSAHAFYIEPSYADVPNDERAPRHSHGAR